MTSVETVSDISAGGIGEFSRAAFLFAPNLTPDLTIMGFVPAFQFRPLPCIAIPRRAYLLKPGTPYPTALLTLHKAALPKGNDKADFAALSQQWWDLAAGPTIAWAGWITFLATYLGYDLPSWSPLWRADAKELLLGKRHTHLEIGRAHV